MAYGGFGKTSSAGRWLFLLAALPLPAQFTTRLSPETEQAFEQYRNAAESGMEWKARFPAAKAGDVIVAPSGKNSSMDVTDGMIHDWSAATIARGVSVEKVLGVLRDYANYKNFYAPEVVDSQLLSRRDNVFRAYLRLVKKTAVPVVLNTEYEVEYRPLGRGRWAVVSRSTKMAEVDGDHEMAPGTGHGFLWKLNAYWLLEPRPEGVYMECRSISLSRNIPPGLGWIIRPTISNMPADSLRSTIEATVRAVR